MRIPSNSAMRMKNRTRHLPAKSADRKAIPISNPKTFVFPFGKHKTKTFEEVWMSEPSYIHWCARDNVIEIPMSSSNGKIKADIEWVNKMLERVPVGLSQAEDQIYIEPLADFSWIKF